MTLTVLPNRSELRSNPQWNTPKNLFIFKRWFVFSMVLNASDCYKVLQKCFCLGRSVFYFCLTQCKKWYNVCPTFWRQPGWVLMFFGLLKIFSTIGSKENLRTHVQENTYIVSFRSLQIFKRFLFGVASLVILWFVRHFNNLICFLCFVFMCDSKKIATSVSSRKWLHLYKYIQVEEEHGVSSTNI